MKNTKTQIMGSSIINLTCSGDKEGSATVTGVEILLKLGEEIDQSKYFTKDGATKEGVMALTQCFVQGLNANIQQAHQNKIWDSAEHLRYVISELERVFVHVVDIKKQEIVKW